MNLILTNIIFLLLITLTTCQFEDDALDTPDIVNENSLELENRAKFAETRDDGLVTTYISPVERIIRGLLKPFTLLTGQSNNNNNNQDSLKSTAEKVIGAVTQEIKNVGRSVKGSFGHVLSLIGSKFKAIYPGTEWCGAGNIAKNSEEVGLFKRSDSCCREHDLCKINMEAGDSQNGLLNNGAFTRSHCSCDSKFLQCLKAARSLVAANIGYTYFNVLRPQCFKEDYPATCVKYGRNRLVNNKCVEYKYDTSKNKTWQWFDNPDYTS